ncbi:hypothetical protein ACP5WH_24645 [Enterocloster bolteae]|uniref:hypothetical protein n=1 Tax=Enterocloster bolteae TaxID=208479 RepID=UPI0002D1E069|nr:hypothetical protein [Enterocloster bolteae]ENZ36704.1 hypothetical protein HMPREF1089_05790 [Enterocloster bolteae 90B3]RGB91065.1 hypothetical protein DWZ21_29675 [Hungatella hathewayi]
MNLKTNFKNDKFSGLRKYKMTTDASTGLTTLEDKTEYQEIGDIFTADDINETNKAVLQNNSEIENIKGIKRIMVPSENWSTSVPYSQTVSVPGAKENIGLIIGGPYLGDKPSASVARERKKAFGYVDSAESGNGVVTLYCYGSKPSTDFQILVKGAGN